MSMQKIKKLVAITGEYTDRNGQTKKQYANCGSLFQRDDGSFAIKLDSLPLGDFNGWISCYDLDENRKELNANGMAQAKQAMDPPAGYHGRSDFEDEDLPF